MGLILGVFWGQDSYSIAGPRWVAEVLAPLFGTTAPLKYIKYGVYGHLINI